MKIFPRIPVPALLFLLLAACAQAPKPAAKKEPPPPPEPVSGQRAFYQMYGAARSWAQDAEGWQLLSVTLKAVKSEGGKYGAWRATFVSPSRRVAKTFTYSVTEAEGIYKGIFAGHEEGYSPSGTTKPFPAIALKIDSDAAYETAMKKGADYTKKNPDKPITLQVERTTRYPNPAWRVIWGESVGTSNFSIFVDATTGEYLQTMH